MKRFSQKKVLLKNKYFFSKFKFFSKIILQKKVCLIYLFTNKNKTILKILVLFILYFAEIVVLENIAPAFTIIRHKVD